MCVDPETWETDVQGLKKTKLNKKFNSFHSSLFLVWPKWISKWVEFYLNLRIPSCLVIKGHILCKWLTFMYIDNILYWRWIWIPRSPDYLGLMIGIWASLGLDFTTISILYPIFSLIKRKYCSLSIFHNQSLGLTKMIQYTLVWGHELANRIAYKNCINLIYGGDNSQNIFLVAFHPIVA